VSSSPVRFVWEHVGIDSFEPMYSAPRNSVPFKRCSCYSSTISCQCDSGCGLGAWDNGVSYALHIGIGAFTQISACKVAAGMVKFIGQQGSWDNGNFRYNWRRPRW